MTGRMSKKRAPVMTQGDGLRLLAYIVGHGHSGSTLLDMILGSHSDMVSLGEVDRVHSFFFRPNAVCTCGKPFPQCHFWKEVYDRVGNVTGIPIPEVPYRMELRKGVLRKRKRRVPSIVEPFLLLGNRTLFEAGCRVLPPLMKYKRFAQNNKIILDAVQQVSGAPVLVDSSKNAVRMKLLYFTYPKRMKCIQLVRDGRAVAASYLRRGQMDSTKLIARMWVRRNLYTEAMIRSIPKGRVTFLRYEDLCREPEKAVRGICAFLGLEFQQDMLRFAATAKHNICGNPMRFEAGDSIELDQRWRDDLSDKDKAAFEKTAGWLNRKYGYSE